MNNMGRTIKAKMIVLQPILMIFVGSISAIVLPIHFTLQRYEDFSNLAREKCIFHIGSYKWVRINPYLTLVRLLFKPYSTCRSIPLLACGVNRSPAVAHMAGKIRDHSRQMGHVLDSIISQWPPKSPPTRRMTPRSWSLAIAFATDLRDIPRISAILWVVILLFSWMSSTILCELVCEPLGVVFSVDLSSLFGFAMSRE